MFRKVWNRSAFHHDARILPGPLRSCRHSSTGTPNPSLPVTIQEWMAKLTESAPRITRDIIDLSRAKALHATLATRADDSNMPGLGDDLGKGWTLCYHWDTGFVQDLGADGSSKAFNAPHPYTRRMWASGTFTFPSNQSIAIGDETVESTRIVKVDYKPKKDLIFVHQEKIYTRPKDKEVLVKERRVHVFRRGVEGSGSLSSQPRLSTDLPTEATTANPPGRPDFSFTYTPNAAHLFRFSALTFNGHKIHYDPVWTREVEGHQGGIVVHGPLTALISIECADKWAAESGQRLMEFDYRAMNPIYAGSEVTFSGRYVDGESGKGGTELEIWAEQGGKVGMKGIAKLVMK